ncbi:MAG: hypothetical protein EAY70_03405 [Sphingomonadales bacterium]|nr:MAG: hypothetical protein EAY70_03405 [Sphingomonadales bacterium]
MSAFHDELWHRITAHRIGPEDIALTFAARLARENRWSLTHAERVIGEYKRFCYLAVTAGHEVTPSDAVDQAWHLHLTYTRDYWQTFCPQVLRSDLHHGPTQGGPVERGRFYRQYADTLAAYEAAFGQAPPPDIWPSAHRRFTIDPRGVRVNFFDGIVLGRRVALALGLLLFAGGWLAGRIV